ncbi:MAG: M28 family peptidase [Planctomycetota bacterium]|nr:MAG: M28 family peptidase [Planctomycetota bacterium]
MRPLPRCLATLLLGACTAASCDSAGDAVAPPPFDAARAWSDLERLVGFGPRPLGSPALAEARAWLRGELEALGFAVEEVSFPVRAPAGARRQGEFRGVNLLARRPGEQPGEIWLASHFDTYDLPGFVGANDGGSSSAVLLEIARQLAGSGPRSGPGLVLCWFDGEEPFSPVPWSNEDNSTFGSRHQVELLEQAGAAGRVRAFILLDMVGDARLGITLPEECDQRLARILERTAHALGQPQLFVGRRPIRDDHVPFYRARIPVVNLIDLRYGPGLSNDWWHTTEDTLDKCSAESMAAVGRIVLAALPEIEREFPVRG